MSLKHLFAGIMGVGFVSVLGVDPSTVGSGSDAPGFAPGFAGDKVLAKADEEKPPEPLGEERDKDKCRVADQNKDADPADKPAASQSSWTARLVFPSGNKF